MGIGSRAANFSRCRKYLPPPKDGAKLSEIETPPSQANKPLRYLPLQPYKSLVIGVSRCHGFELPFQVGTHGVALANDTVHRSKLLGVTG